MITAPWWGQLSGTELRQRLERRGVAPELAAGWCAARDRGDHEGREARAAIGTLLGP